MNTADFNTGYTLLDTADFAISSILKLELQLETRPRTELYRIHFETDVPDFSSSLALFHSHVFTVVVGDTRPSSSSSSIFLSENLVKNAKTSSCK